MKTVEELLKDPSVVFLVDGEEAHQTTVVYFNPDTKNSDFCGLCLKDGFLHRIDRQGVLIDSADLCKLIPRPVKATFKVRIYADGSVHGNANVCLARDKELIAVVEREFQEGEGL